MTTPRARPATTTTRRCRSRSRSPGTRHPTPRRRPPRRSSANRSGSKSRHAMDQARPHAVTCRCTTFSSGSRFGQYSSSPFAHTRYTRPGTTIHA
eukprot:3071624-Rhodomonas_salina.1